MWETVISVEGASSDEEEQEAGDVYDDVELEPLTTGRQLILRLAQQTLQLV